MHDNSAASGCVFDRNLESLIVSQFRDANAVDHDPSQIIIRFAVDAVVHVTKAVLASKLRDERVRSRGRKALRCSLSWRSSVAELRQ